MFLHISETYTGAQTISLLADYIDKVVHCVLLPGCRVVILLKQESHLIQSLHNETKTLPSLEEEEEDQPQITIHTKLFIQYMLFCVYSCSG